MDKIPDEIWFDIVDNLRAAIDYYNILSSREPLLKNGSIALEYDDYFANPRFFHIGIPNESSILFKSITSLASTNKRLRRIGLPAIFRSLTFCGLPDHATSGLITLIRTYMRVKSLSHSPHCLMHVRELSLLSWHASHEALAYRGYCEWELRRTGSESEAFHMFAEVYKVVTSLVSRMPQLRTLVLDESELSLRLCDDLSRLPCFSSLSLLIPYRDMTSDPLEMTSMPLIRHLRYENTHYDPESSLLERILPLCLDGLESLEINGAHLPLLASYARNRNLSLKSLCILFGGAFEPYDKAYDEPYIWEILQACLELRSLIIEGEPPSVKSPNISVHHLPKLTAIWAPWAYLRELTVERQIDTVMMRRARCFGSITDILRGSVLHLQRFTVHSIFYSPLELLQFVDSLRPFENLTRISITYLNFGEEWGEGVDLKLRDRLVNGLHALKRLDHCTIAENIFGTSNYTCLKDIGCPIGTERDCNNRGHPSLTTIWIDIFSPHVWVWENGLGWTRRELIAGDLEDR